MKKYISRTIEKNLLSAAKYSPVIALTGPRQTGKSTMLMRLFPQYDYISFDSIDIRTFAK